MKKLTPGKLVIASHNAGKVREIRALLEPYGIEPISAAIADSIQARRIPGCTLPEAVRFIIVAFTDSHYGLCLPT